MSKLDDAQAKALQRRHDKISDEAAACVVGLYEPRYLDDGTENPRYNADAHLQKSQMSVKTYASLKIYEQDRADKREVVGAAARAFGQVVVQGKVSEDDWATMVERTKMTTSHRKPSSRVVDVEPQTEDEPA